MVTVTDDSTRSTRTYGKRAKLESGIAKSLLTFLVATLDYSQEPEVPEKSSISGSTYQLCPVSSESSN